MTNATHRPVEAKVAPLAKGLPFLGSLLDARKDPVRLFMQARREHGDVVRFQFGPWEYFLINDLEGIRRILIDNNTNYTKSPSYKGLRLVIGTGLLTSEGDFWRRQRKLAQPAFHKDRLAGFAETMSASTKEMLDRWSAMKVGAEFDVHEEMTRLTFRLVGQTLFSTDIDGDAKSIGQALTIALHHANEYAQSIVAVPTWVPTPQNFRFKKALQALDQVVLRIIDERRQGKKAEDLLSMLMAVKDSETGESMSDQQLRDEVMTLVLAGHETTANALSWTLYLLSTHPEIERRLVAELDSVLGGRPPTLQDLPRLTYCTNVIQESMRLYPPAWAFERQAIDDDVVGGYPIPKKAIVGISPFTLHRTAAHWDNPEGFDPDRFTAERSEGRPKNAYLPFGGGPRLCIGNAFAMMETQVIVASIVQRVRLSLVPGHPVELEPVVTLRPKHGIRVVARPRSAGLGPTPSPPASADIPAGRCPLSFGAPTASA